MKFLNILGNSSLVATAFALSSLPALSYELNMIAPTTLTINGQNIVRGSFQVTTGIGYTSNGSSVNLGPSVLNSNAEIGNPNPFTVYTNIQDDVEVLELIGNFTSSDPSLTPAAANFHIIVGAFNGQALEFTNYLPATTSQVLSYQISDVESDPSFVDNTNTFLDSTLWGAPVISLTAPVSGQLIETFTQTGQTWYVSSSPIGSPPPPPVVTGCAPVVSSLPLNPHGSNGSSSTVSVQNCQIPEPSSSASLLALGVLGMSYVVSQKLKIKA